MKRLLSAAALAATVSSPAFAIDQFLDGAIHVEERAGSCGGDLVDDSDSSVSKLRVKIDRVERFTLPGDEAWQFDMVMQGENVEYSYRFSVNFRKGQRNIRSGSGSVEIRRRIQGHDAQFMRYGRIQLDWDYGPLWANSLQGVIQNFKGIDGCDVRFSSSLLRLPAARKSEFNPREIFSDPIDFPNAFEE